MDEQATFETQPVLAPRRRRRNLAAAAIAAFVVGATVIAGLAGRTADALRPTAAPVAVAELPPDPTSPPVTSMPGPQYPASVLGLQVWSAAYVSTYGLIYFSGSIAVAGWYRAEPDNGCRPPKDVADPALPFEFGVAADVATFCDRSGNLFTAPMFDENVAPIGITLRPGVAAPYELDDEGVVTPVVFVGKLVWPDKVCHTPNACQANLLVDRVAWAAGNDVPLMSSVQPRLLASWPPLAEDARDTAAMRGIGYRAQILVETLVDPETLARVDPHVAELLETTETMTDRIWYRRVLGLDPAQDPMHWVAIDDETGTLIASGFER